MRTTCLELLGMSMSWDEKTRGLQSLAKNSDRNDTIDISILQSDGWGGRSHVNVSSLMIDSLPLGRGGVRRLASGAAHFKKYRHFKEI